MAANTVGFIGLGNMGIPMTRRLVDAGYHVRGFDVSAEARRNFEAIGSSGAGGGVAAITELGSVGDGADAVILMLPDSDIVERVLLGRLSHAHALRFQTRHNNQSKPAHAASPSMRPRPHNNIFCPSYTYGVVPAN